MKIVGIILVFLSFIIGSYTDSALILLFPIMLTVGVYFIVGCRRIKGEVPEWHRNLEKTLNEVYDAYGEKIIIKKSDPFTEIQYGYETVTIYGCYNNFDSIEIKTDRGNIIIEHGSVVKNPTSLPDWFILENYYNICWDH